MTRSKDIDGVSDLQIVVEAELDRTSMLLKDILNLAADSTIRLSRPAGENIDLLVGGYFMCSGEIVVINESIAVRITDFREDPV